MTVRQIPKPSGIGSQELIAQLAYYQKFANLKTQAVTLMFASLPRLNYIFYYSKAHATGFIQHFELERPSNYEINQYHAEELMSVVVPYAALKEVTHGMVCLSESHQGLNFRDVIHAQRY